MELVTIYQDDECTVEMYKPFADFLSDIGENEFRLSPVSQEEYLSDVLSILKWFFILKGKHIITSSKVPILHRGKVFEVTTQYQVFEDAVLMLSNAFDLTNGAVSSEWKENLLTLIELYYSTQHNKQCVLHFFDDKAYRVSGFIAIDGEKDIIILPFFLNENDDSYRLY